MPSIADTLRTVINPQSVAVIGASADTAKFGGRVMQFLIKHGYAGRIVPINPNAASVLGVTAYSTIADAREEIDVALLAVPSLQLPKTLEQCGAAGVRCSVIITADFAELGDAGAERERELVRIAKRYGMRLIGPNCLGFINPHLKLALTSSVALATEPMPRGAIGLVTQSGSMMASMISHAVDTGAGFSACVTVGNQADLETCDFIEYFLHDERTRAICTYIEGLRDGRRFLNLAQACRAAGKPLLALKAGRSDAGSRIARSHTASLAGSPLVWEAACRKTGVISVDDPESMVDCAHFLVTFGAAKNPGVAVLSPSGGTIAVTADRLASAGLQLADLTPQTCERLREIVPAPRPLNPLDVGGLPRERGVSAANEAQAILADDPQVGVTFIVVATSPQLDDKVRQWGEAAMASRKPTALLFTPGSLVDSARKTLREIGCPFTNRMDDALRVLRAAADYGRALPRPETRAEPPDYVLRIRARLDAFGERHLTELETKSLLDSAGVPVTADVLVTSEDEAVEAAERLGYPAVLKAVCRDLVHKSDIGAVALDLRGKEAIRDAWTRVTSNINTHCPSANIDGCVVQPMITGGHELMLGTKWDAQFGAVVVVGSGGIWVEVVKDVVVALAPLSEHEALSTLQALRMWPLLTGARGTAASDLSALIDALVRLSWIADTAGRQLVELDINPLLVRPDGVVALDARATLADR